MATDFINNIISKLSSGKKECVFISVSPNIGVEMALIDATNQMVKKYGYKVLDYNESLKEIKDYQEFKILVRDLFDELEISTKSPVVLSIPTVHVGKVELPIILADDMVQEAIVSEAEQSYIFKRCEPVVSWVEIPGTQDADKRTLLYSAVQKPAVDSIKEALSSLGTDLERLEISLISDLRALAYTGIAETQMTEGTAWTLMLIKSNGYELVQMNGQKICDFYAEPLALKTYEMEEVYDAIYTSVQIALLNYPTNNLVILSETDMVSAQHMAEKMQIEGNITYVENNKFRKQDYMPVNLDVLPEVAAKLSLDAIGTASYYIQTLQSDFEFSGNSQNSVAMHPIYINWKGKQYEITEMMLLTGIMAVGLLLIIPTLIALLAFSSVEKNNQKKLDDTNWRIGELDSEIAGINAHLRNEGFDVTTEIERIVKSNRKKLIAYSSVGESIPKKIWLKYLGTREDGKIDIVGISESVEDIYVFYRNLKDSVVDSQLRLGRLEMLSDSLEDAVNSSSNYEFEITDMSEEELKAKIAAMNPQPEGGDNGGNPVNGLEQVEVH